MRGIALIFLLNAVFAPAIVRAADAPKTAPRPDCDARPNAYMRVECRVIVDPTFDQKWRRMTPSEMQDAVDVDPCVGFFSAERERECRAARAKKSK